MLARRKKYQIIVQIFHSVTDTSVYVIFGESCVAYEIKCDKYS